MKEKSSKLCIINFIATLSVLSLKNVTQHKKLRSWLHQIKTHETQNMRGVNEIVKNNKQKCQYEL